MAKLLELLDRFLAWLFPEDVLIAMGKYVLDSLYPVTVPVTP